MATRAPFTELISFGDKGYGDELMWGAVSTLIISAGAYAVGLSIGLCGAGAKLGSNRPALWIAEFYTTIVRAVPELVLILLLYYAGTSGLNEILKSYGYEGVQINGMVAAIVVLGFVQGAYSTEVIRAAIQAIPIGQIEAAKAFGMTPVQRFWRIILPAMLPYAMPGLTNLWMVVTKDSALVAVVGFTELALATRQASGNSKFYLGFYLLTAMIYLSITLVSNAGLKPLERHLRRGFPKLG
jgi:polar amino acid transport system permease protein